MSCKTKLNPNGDGSRYFLRIGGQGLALFGDFVIFFKSTAENLAQIDFANLG